MYYLHVFAFLCVNIYLWNAFICLFLFQFNYLLLLLLLLLRKYVHYVALNGLKLRESTIPVS